MARFRLWLVLALFIVILIAAAWVMRHRFTASDEPVKIYAPAELSDTPAVLARRREAQLQTIGQFKVFHQFSFTDKIDQSGITFRHHVVDDATCDYTPDHYDHGNGLAVADVDGDGRYDIFFVNQVGRCELWRNLGGGHFEDITERAGVGLADPIKVTASFVDINNDGFPDLCVTTVRQGVRLFLNDGTGRFTDISSSCGIDYVGHSSAAVFFDYDRDGLPDLFLCNISKYTMDTEKPVSGTQKWDPDGKYKYYKGSIKAFRGELALEQCRLYKNMGDCHFKDVTVAMGVEGISNCGDATPLDIRGDGWPGLYVLDMEGSNEYLENDHGRRFIRRGSEYFARTPWGAMGVKAFDWNNQGRLGLLVTDMHSDMTHVVLPTYEAEKQKSEMLWLPSGLGPKRGTNSLFGNAFFVPGPDGHFTDQSDALGLETFWPWGVSVGDVNADGWDDVFITAGMSYPLRYGINSLLLNNRGEKFLDAEFIVGIEPRRGGRFADFWFQLDGAGGDRDNPLVAGHHGKVDVWAALSSRSSAIVDLDGDGALDIVTSEFNERPMLLMSDLAQKKTIHYLQVKLVGALSRPRSDVAPGQIGPSNREGLGAVVRLRAAGMTQTKVMDGKSGYLSQSVLPLYFGLGDATVVDQIDITWPDGRRQSLPGPIAPNRLLTIEEK